MTISVIITHHNTFTFVGFVRRGSRLIRMPFDIFGFTFLRFLVQKIDNPFTCDRGPYASFWKSGDFAIYCQYCLLEVDPREADGHQRLHQQECYFWDYFTFPNFYCIICDKRVQRGKFKGHYLEHAQQSAACPSCSTLIVGEKALRKHLKTCWRQKTPKKTQRRTLDGRKFWNRTVPVS